MIVRLRMKYYFNKQTWYEDTPTVLGVNRQAQYKLGSIRSVHHFPWKASFRKNWERKKDNNLKKFLPGMNFSPSGVSITWPSTNFGPFLVSMIYEAGSLKGKDRIFYQTTISN